MPFRDNDEALGGRAETLERELAEIDRERARLTERAHKAQAERRSVRARRGPKDKTKREVSRGSARTALPLLHQLRVASPCKESWADMEGDARVRHCGKCATNVYNLSEMSRAEAAALLEEHEGKLCVRYYERPDGTVMTKDCPRGARVRGVGRGAAGVAFASLFALGLGNLPWARMESAPRRERVGFFVEFGHPFQDDCCACTARPVRMGLPVYTPARREPLEVPLTSPEAVHERSPTRGPRAARRRDKDHKPQPPKRDKHALAPDAASPTDDGDK